MGWASHLIKQLNEGETVQFRPRGSSMKGKIESGQLCTVEPLRGNLPAVGDIVLCKVKGREFLHLVVAIRNGQYQIGNAKGRINGWITLNTIYGKCIKVER